MRTNTGGMPETPQTAPPAPALPITARGMSNQSTTFHALSLYEFTCIGAPETLRREVHTIDTFSAKVQ